MKTAILQCADTGPVESLAEMLGAVGYRCFLPDAALRGMLRELGGLVLSPEGLRDSMGYEIAGLPLATPADFAKCDLLADVKAHQTHDKLIRRWPRLERRVLWYRINGGKPEHVIRKNDDGSIREDCGDEVNPPCPVLTPNQWYRPRFKDVSGGMQWSINETTGKLWENKAYVCWPPFVRWEEHQTPRVSEKVKHRNFDPPICLIHNLHGWGYGLLASEVRRMGVRCHGAGSPDGLLPHEQIKVLLSRTMAMVHLKSSDAPGYALYEALASACPVICSRRLIWRCRMEELLIPNETCLVFDRETHDAMTLEEARYCAGEIAAHLKRLADPDENFRIGQAGREWLWELMWDRGNAKDVESLRAFMVRNFAQ